MFERVESALWERSFWKPKQNNTNQVEGIDVNSLQTQWKLTRTDDGDVDDRVLRKLTV